MRVTFLSEFKTMFSKGLHDKYSNYHYCIVRECKNTSIRNPEKLWIKVPSDEKMRNTWLQLANRDPVSLSSGTAVYFCEDHFNLESDMENYIRYKIMGSVKRIKMNPNCVPTRFSCQTEGNRKHLVTKVEGVVKKRVHSIEKSSLSNSSDASGDPVVSASTSNQPVQSNEKQLITRETRTEDNETYENLADNRQIMVKIEDEEILEKLQNSINYETKTVTRHVEDKVKTDRPRRTQVTKNILEVTNVVCGSKRKKEATLKRKVICSPKVYQNALATKVDTIIARVYQFFKKEYDFLAKKYGKLLDLTPFSKHKERTAQATGFHINVVEKAVAEVVKKPGKKPTKKKRKKNIKKIEVEDNRLPISECPDVTPKVEPIEQLSEPDIGLPSEDTSSVNETSILTSALPETDPLKIEADSFEDTEYSLEDLADIKEEIEFSDEGFS